jgi:hypothetical protein
MTISVATLTTASSNVYVSSSGNSAITSLTLCNYSPGNVQVNLYVVPANLTPGTSTIALANLNLTTEDTYQLYAAAEKLLLGPNDYIAANASANSSVTVIVSSTTL